MTLVKAMAIKERIFWKRTISMKKKIGWFGFLIALVFITLAHYAFAFMTFMSEAFMWAIGSPQFKVNVAKMCAAK
jgi:hypothetical protein